ncbi:ribonuclease HI/exo-alpha-sialidase [Trypanosoma cruzi]|nr:ribonuclease HI/exo-alpha-sialidase [Trypanosoma cruzi]
MDARRRFWLRRPSRGGRTGACDLFFDTLQACSRLGGVASVARDKCGLLLVQLLHVPMCISHAEYTLVRDSLPVWVMCVGRDNSKMTGESAWALQGAVLLFCIPLVVLCVGSRRSVCADAWQKRPP